MAKNHHHNHQSEALGTAAAATIAFALVETLGGWWTGSLALLSDAGHMLTDGAALGLGTLAAWMARMPPSRRHSYGLGRAEVVAAMVNATAMLVIVIAIAWEAVVRFRQPAPVNGLVAALIAAAGLALNLWVLRRLAPRASLHFTGHIIAPPGGSGRFPAEAEAAVAAEIETFLDRQPVGAGYGSLAAGADILIVEALARRGIPFHLVLPFDVADFLSLSV